MVQEDTIKRMRSTALLPALAIREMRASWEKHGRRDVYSKAMQQVKKILAQDNPAVFGKEIDQKIRSRFKDLVPGNTGLNND